MSLTEKLALAAFVVYTVTCIGIVNLAKGNKK